MYWKSVHNKSGSPSNREKRKPYSPAYSPRDNQSSFQLHSFESDSPSKLSQKSKINTKKSRPSINSKNQQMYLLQSQLTKVTVDLKLILNDIKKMVKEFQKIITSTCQGFETKFLKIIHESTNEISTNLNKIKNNLNNEVKQVKNTPTHARMISDGSIKAPVKAQTIQRPKTNRSIKQQKEKGKQTTKSRDMTASFHGMQVTIQTMKQLLKHS